MEDRRPGPVRPLGRFFDRRRPRRQDGEDRRSVPIAPAVGVVGAGGHRRDRGRFVTGATRPRTGGGGPGNLVRLEIAPRMGRIPGGRPVGEQRPQILVDRPQSGMERARWSQPAWAVRDRKRPWDKSSNSSAPIRQRPHRSKPMRRIAPPPARRKLAGKRIAAFTSLVCEEDAKGVRKPIGPGALIRNKIHLGLGSRQGDWAPVRLGRNF